MSHTYSSNRIHVIFSTKERQKCLREEIQPKLWAYIAGIAKIMDSRQLRSVALKIIATP